MPTGRKRGRPPKRGKWVYVVGTGDLINRKMASYHTDSEVKAALRKFFEPFQDEARRLCTKDENAELLQILSEIAYLKEGPDDAQHLSSFTETIRYQWAFQWGASLKKMHAVATVQRIRDEGEQDVKVDNGFL